jgi:hypothetical protein
MWQWIKQNWREIVGWVAIAYLFLFVAATNSSWASAYGKANFESFEAMVVLIVFVLSWLRLNRK